MKLKLIASIFLCYLSNAQAITITPTDNLNDLITSLGFFDHNELTVTGVHLNYGDADGGIYDDPGSIINSLPNISVLNGTGSNFFLTSVASTGKKTQPGYIPPKSTGTYTNSDGTYGLPTSGIILSTGKVSDYESGPNTTGSKTTAWGNAATPSQEALLSEVTGIGHRHYDVTQLDITFDADSSVTDIFFQAVFGSEEFSGYVGTAFNDGFGIFLNGKNIAGVIPDGETTTSTISISHPDMNAVSGTQLNGVIDPTTGPLLRFSAPVIGGSTNNTLSIIIGDRADQLYDSSVYLRLSEVNSTSQSDNGDPSDGYYTESGNNSISPLICASPACLMSISSSGKKYQSTGSKFAKIFLPSLQVMNDIDELELWIWNGVEFYFQQMVLANQEFDFTTINPDGIDQFMLLGVDPSLHLDLSDPRALAIGATFVGAIKQEDLIVSIVSTVEVPSTLFLLVIGLFPYIRYKYFTGSANRKYKHH